MVKIYDTRFQNFLVPNLQTKDKESFIILKCNSWWCGIPDGHGLSGISDGLSGLK